MFTFVGLIISVLQLFEAPRRLSQWIRPAAPPPYDLALEASIRSLHRSNICLTSKLIDLDPDENDPQSMVNSATPSCKIDLAPLHVFAENYTNYLSQIPYSGAESFKSFTATLIASQIEINKANSVDGLLAAQKRIDMSLSEVGFWMCGMEWYLRLAPEGAGPDKAPFKGISLTDTWNQWDKKHARGFLDSVRRRLNYQYDDKTNTCSGFIDLID